MFLFDDEIFGSQGNFPPSSLEKSSLFTVLWSSQELLQSGERCQDASNFSPSK